MGTHPFDRYAAFTDLTALIRSSAKPLRKSIRVNLLKTSVQTVLDWGREKGWQMTPVPWCSEGFFIEREDREKALGKDLLHLTGHIYLQEAASMLPVALLDVQPGQMVLDMSAAPGSKTTQMASSMRGRGVIIANDVQEKRLWTLKSSLHRSGVKNVIVTRKVGQWFAKHVTERFDRVLCDAPCTAQGTSRKDSDALNYCSPENIGKMAKLQRELLESAVHACKVGGRIVYSTCTLTPEENEEVVGSVLNKYVDQLEIVDTSSMRIKNQELGMKKGIEDSIKVQEKIDHNSQFLIHNSQPFIRLWPQTYDTEGFFCAVLHKKAPTKAREKMDMVRFQEEELPRARSAALVRPLEERFGMKFLEEGDRLFQIGDRLLIAAQEVAECRLPVADYALGLPFGLRTREDHIRLDHETAILSGNHATKTVYDLNEPELHALLSGKDITCPGHFSGDILLRYKHLCIGIGLALKNDTSSTLAKLKNRLPRWVVAKS